MDPNDRTDFSEAKPEGRGDLVLLVLCSLVALAVATAMVARLLARQSPPWLVGGAGLAVFPFLPLIWHGLAEGGTKNRPATLLNGKSRFALRTLAVALVILGVSMADLGPNQVVRNLSDLALRLRGKSGATSLPLPGTGSAHGLESFIPADATLVVGLAGSTAVAQLLAAHGVDTRDKLAALATCKIDFSNARVLIAARGRGTQMIVVRAPGITDERNLYCLVGVMGPDRLQIRSDGTGNAKTLEVSGFLSRPLTFQLLDQATAIATDAAWRATADQKLLAADGATAEGRLAQPLLRVERTAPLWVVSVDETPQGEWDLALDSRAEGDRFQIRGSATPPAGAGDRASISVTVPLAFARALPEGAVALGIRGVEAAIMATSAGQPPIVPSLAPPPPASPAQAAGAR
jgi:hypothetical protein